MTRAKKPLARSAAELVAIVAVALGLALLIQAFIVKPYEIPSGSMLPTLHINQRILVDRVGADFSSPQVGQVWVFHPPASETCADSRQGENQVGRNEPAACDVAQTHESSQTYVKRVVGLPGDHLYISNGQVYRNGVREKAPYAVPCIGGGECNFPTTITVPKGDYYMMGDNRPDSLDSRFWGPVPKAWMIGQVFFTYWPPDRIGFL
ncbi:MAG TPA: signal peptidase I [Solirubrobacteraceae bacterium]|nr:signal peptidase I [Solirubrobacteraceae bacterium]